MIRLVLKPKSDHPDWTPRFAQIQFTVFVDAPLSRVEGELVPLLSTEYHVETSHGDPPPK